ncbi:MAG: EAL domain-containing protein, partial [Burkholderiaceae bacterium]
ADLRNAVQNKEFYLDYQPQFSGDGRRLVAFEALIRWQHPVSGRIAPDTFIPVAERMQLMNDIGRFALQEACKFASEWPGANSVNKPLTIAVNVSPSQFVDGAILEAVDDALAQSGLDPHQLELEITEQMLINDFNEVAAVLNTLRNKGIRIAIDDFGSGQTSLRYLEQIPISKIQIDRAFVRGLGNDNRANDITQSIVQMGHKLGCTVVAEGVEETAQADLLHSWNCDQMQGFMYSRPLSSDDAMQLLARQRQDIDAGVDAIRESNTSNA